MERDAEDIVLSGPQMNPLVSELNLYDIANTPGVAADVGHMNCRATVTVRIARYCRSTVPRSRESIRVQD